MPSFVYKLSSASTIEQSSSVVQELRYSVKGILNNGSTPVHR